MAQHKGGQRSSSGVRKGNGTYMLNGRAVRDGINGLVHDAATGQPINAATGKGMSDSAVGDVINPGGRTRIYGQLPRSANDGLNRYDPSVTLPTASSAGNAGSGGQGLDPDAPAYIAPQAPAPTTPSPSTGRNDSAPDGSNAKGTNTGFKGYEIDLDKANGLLGRLGLGQMADANSFLSEQLPVSAAEKPVALPTTEGPGIIGVDGKVGHGYVTEGISTPGKTGQSPIDTADNNRAISVPGEQKGRGMPGNSRSNGTRQRGYVDSRFEDGAEYGESYAVERTPGREAYRSAFLAGDGDSMTALRNADRAVGRFVQGGKTLANDGGTLVEISKEAGEKMKTGTLSAQEFKDARVGEVKSTLVPVDTPDITSTQTPGSNSNNDSDGFSVGDAVSGGMSQSDAEAIGSGGQVETVFTPGGGQEREFDYNNGQPIKDETYFGQKEKGIQAMKERFFKK